MNADCCLESLGDNHTSNLLEKPESVGRSEIQGWGIAEEIVKDLRTEAFMEGSDKQGPCEVHSKETLINQHAQKGHSRVKGLNKDHVVEAPTVKPIRYEDDEVEQRATFIAFTSLRIESA